MLPARIRGCYGSLPARRSLTTPAKASRAWSLCTSASASCEGGFASLRQAQLELTPFKEDRLKAVALRLRELSPAQDPERLETHICSAFVDRMVAQVTTGFKGDVGVVPRQFLRELVTQMD